MKEVKIKFEAVGSKKTVADICNNFCECYPEFSSNMEEEDYRYDDKTKEFMILWAGSFNDDELSSRDINTLIRLTHHAEGFYEMTDAEFVHVEVFIDGEWYGKCE